jgi:hypothetical protein
MTLVASGLTSGVVSPAGCTSVGACTSASSRLPSERTGSSSWRFLGGRTLDMNQMLRQSRTSRNEPEHELPRSRPYAPGGSSAYVGVPSIHGVRAASNFRFDALALGRVGRRGNRLRDRCADVWAGLSSRPSGSRGQRCRGQTSATSTRLAAVALGSGQRRLVGADVHLGGARAPRRRLLIRRHSAWLPSASR